MSNPWKLATIGIALTGVTALSTGVTTAYLMRSSMPTEPVAVVPTPATSASVARSAATAAAPVRRAARVTRPASPGITPAVATQPAVVTPASAPVATDCSTGTDRAMKIAKPGLLGTVAGAGLGAIGGALADGGSGAGKGALIGGLAGAALGGGYGAYRTKQECGTIFGDAAPGFATAPTVASVPAAPQAALHGSQGNGITVYSAR